MAQPALELAVARVGLRRVATGPAVAKLVGRERLNPFGRTRFRQQLVEGRRFQPKKRRLRCPRLLYSAAITSQSQARRGLDAATTNVSSCSPIFDTSASVEG